MLQDILEECYSEALIKGTAKGFIEGLEQGREKEKKRIVGILRRNEFCIKEISDITGLSYEAVEAIGKGKDYLERLFEDYYKEAFEDGYKQGLKKGLDKGTEEEKDKIAKELSKRGHPLRFTEPLN